jgi:Tol biopolymer transport system component
MVTGDSFGTAVSADGRYTVFTSMATNLVQRQNNANSNQNVFLYDRATGTIRLVNHQPGSVSMTGDGGIPGTVRNVGSRPPAALRPVLSANGNVVAFASFDDDLVPGETPAGTSTPSVYLDNVQNGSVLLVNHAPGSPNTIAGSASNPAVSAGGRYVAYVLDPSSPDPANPYSIGEIALYDSASDTTTILPGTRDGDASDPTISDNGRFISYLDQGQVYVFDRDTGGTVLASHDNSSPGSTTPANGNSSAPVISHDGSAVAFVSAATNLIPGQVPSSFTNVFLYRNDTSGHDAVGSIQLVSGAGGSVLGGGDNNSDSPAVDGDGSFVAYRSDADNLVSGQSGATGNVFEFNTRSNTQALVSHVAGQGAALTTGAGGASEPVIDDDGHLVAYASTAGKVVSGQTGPGGVQNIFVWLRQTGANILVSGAGGSATATGNADSDSPLLARDAFPDFTSVATNLANGTGGSNVVYLNALVQIVPAGGSSAIITIDGAPVGQLTLAPDAVFTGSPPGSVVGSLSVATIVAGQFLPPGYSLPGGQADNSLFGLSGTALVALFQPSGTATYAIVLHVNIGFGDDPVVLPVVAVPGVGSGHPLEALLVLARVGKRKTLRLTVEVFDVVTGAEVLAIVSPFQSPKYRAIRLVPMDLNGDGITDLIELMARKGKHNVTALLPV